MSEYPCKYDGCDDQMMNMGYCNVHWQEVKETWTPAEMEDLTKINTTQKEEN
jgi:hypothetical protein